MGFIRRMWARMFPEPFYDTRHQQQNTEPVNISGWLESPEGRKFMLTLSEADRQDFERLSRNAAGSRDRLPRSPEDVEKATQQATRAYQLVDEVRRLAKDAGLGVSRWLENSEGRNFMLTLSASDRQSLQDLLRRSAQTKTEAAHQSMRRRAEDEGRSAQSAIDERWRSARNAETQAQALLEVHQSPLTAPAALAMAAALARRGKLNEANMRRAEELYEDRVKKASADYWPTGESVVSLLFGPGHRT
ncbi:hypothetical protein AB0I98_29420 [Streptomyces sp. NPDC050211]|uniref:hypothetical protein n=1 Tax=Streptomyces sp. NPDC050211 TaxID=3154932 RepID=UPI003431767A